MDGLRMKYFVLKPRGDDVYAYASREAMLTYAAIVQPVNPGLSDDIKQWVLSVGPAQRREGESMKDPRECKSWEEWTTSVATWFDLWSETARHMTDMQRVIDSQYAEIAALNECRAKVATAAELLRFAFADGRRSGEERRMAREILEAIGEPLIEAQRREGDES